MIVLLRLAVISGAYLAEVTQDASILVRIFLSKVNYVEEFGGESWLSTIIQKIAAAGLRLGQESLPRTVNGHAILAKLI